MCIVHFYHCLFAHMSISMFNLHIFQLSVCQFFFCIILIRQLFTLPLCCTWLYHRTLWLCLCICCIVCACTHAWIHACVRICASAFCLPKYAGTHACRCQWSVVYFSGCTACLSPPKSLWVSVWASESVCSLVLLDICEQCFSPAGLCPLPSPRSGWCSTSAQLLSSTQWLL